MTLNSREALGARRHWVLPLVAVALISCTAEAETESGQIADSQVSDSQVSESQGPVVLDDAGVSHYAAPHRRRVISTIPGVTDLFVSLGATDRLVGRTRYDTRAEVAHLPSIGGGLDPDLETLTVLEPDLVVMWTDTDARSMTTRIAELGIETYAGQLRGMDDFRQHARQLGQLTGLEAEVAEVLAGIERTFDGIQGRIAGAERPTVLYVIAVDPPMVAGPGTFLDDLVTISGGVNVFADLKMAWPQVSMEAIVQRNPDVVVVSVQGGSHAPLAERDDGWSQVEAVREGRVIRVDPNLFNRPGPGVGEAALSLARALHPGLFGPVPFDSATRQEGS